MVWDKLLPLMILLIFNLKEIIMKTYTYSEGVSPAGSIGGLSMFTCNEKLELILWADLNDMTLTLAEDYNSAWDKAISVGGALITIGQDWSEGGMQCYYALAN